MPGESESGAAQSRHDGAPAGSEQLNIKVVDYNNEVSFKVNRSTRLENVMTAFLRWRGGHAENAAFFFSEIRVQKSDTAGSLNMVDGDTIKVHWSAGGYPCVDGSCQCCA